MDVWRHANGVGSGVLVKLYAMAISARHESDTERRIDILPGIVLADNCDDATQRGMPAALQAFPKEAGWDDHRVAIMEVEAPLDVEGYRLTWQIEATR